MGVCTQTQGKGYLERLERGSVTKANELVSTAKQTVEGSIELVYRGVLYQCLCSMLS